MKRRKSGWHMSTAWVRQLDATTARLSLFQLGPRTYDMHTGLGLSNRSEQSQSVFPAAVGREAQNTSRFANFLLWAVSLRSGSWGVTLAVYHASQDTPLASCRSVHGSRQVLALHELTLGLQQPAEQDGVGCQPFVHVVSHFPQLNSFAFILAVREQWPNSLHEALPLA